MTGNEPMGRPDGSEPARERGQGERAALDDALAACLRESTFDEQRAALERACEAEPALEGELRRRFRVLCELGLDGACRPEPHAPPAGPLDSFGDFELLELLGVGGMGIVHRARQKSLDREVVVKLVRPDQLHSPTVRERFRREAEAVARLQHPGIVPIHFVGDHSGLPFFAMEFVEGCNLAERLDDLDGRAPEGLGGIDLSPGFHAPDREVSWVEACLHVARGIADALAHAHARGILHRDIKPSNVLLTVEARTRLIDFGLHALSESSESEHARDRLTREGAPPGTLLYMAPEQLERGRYDERSEVYALAATLYELLTLQPPYRAGDRTSTERLIRAGRPDAIRPRNRAVRPDVEAVVLKALAVDPARRYGDMQAFAEDLQRLIEGRPVRARPEGALYRLRRWIGREPKLASAIALAVALAVAAPAWVILEQRTHTAQLARLLDEEREARAETEDLTQLLVDVFDSADPDRGPPSEVARELLRRGTQRLEERLADRPRSRALMQTALGRIHGNLGLLDQGVELLSSAVETLEAERASLDRESAGLPDDVRDAESRRLLAALADARARLAGLLETRGSSLAVLEVRRALEDDLEALQGPEHWETLVAGANVLRLAADLQAAGTDVGDDAVDLDDVDRALRAAVAAVDGAQDASIDERARIHGWLGSLLVRRAQLLGADARRPVLTDAEHSLQRSRELLEESARGDSLEAADVVMAQGVAVKLLGRLAEAEELYRVALEIYEQRLDEDDHRRAGALVNLAALLQTQGRLDEAVGPLEEGWRALALQLGPDSPFTVQSEGNLLGLLVELGRFDGLRERYDELIPRQARVLGEESLTLVASYERRSRACLAEGDREGARRDLARALEAMQLQPEPNEARMQVLRQRIDELAP